MLRSVRTHRAAKATARNRRMAVETLELRALLAADVFISEFLAANGGTLLDEDGQSSDWIELYNAGDVAQNLDGWFLTDDAAQPDQWRIPAVSLSPGSHLVVFASGKNRTDPAGPLHTNFSLAQSGEYLGLFRPADLVAVSQFAPAYPPQRTDVSYGPNATVVTTQLVAGDAAATVLVPSVANGGNTLGDTWTGQPAGEPFNDAAWIHGPLPVGYSNTASAGVETQSFASAASATLAGWTGYRNVDATLHTNFGFSASVNAGSALGELGGVVPGRTAEIAYYADTQLGGTLSQQQTLTASGRLSAESISAFDGGFEIGWFNAAVTQGVTNFIGVRIVDGTGTSLRWGPHRDINGSSELIEGANQLNVGEDYLFTLNYDPNGGGAGNGVLQVEFRRASDNVLLATRVLNFSSAGAAASLNAFGLKTLDFNANIGGSVNVFVDQLAYSALVDTSFGTDLDGPMHGINSSALVRTTFTLADPGAVDRLTLPIRYNDGFVAYLNGVEVARRNAPDPVLWDSTATVQRSQAETAIVESINLTDYRSELQAGQNVLAIHGLNFTSTDDDFAIAPELVARSVNFGPLRYHLTPTPGDDNGEGVLGFVEDTQFNLDRGFYTEPINVVITTPTPGAMIVYTLDGSTPTLTNGVQVPAPDAVTPPTAVVPTLSSTTTLRAAAFKDPLVSTNVDTHTYLFLADVAQQSTALALGRGFPDVWQPGYTADYEMDPTVVGDPQFGDLMDDSLRAIPTLSIVADLDGLFGPTNGIYNHSENRGDEWERAASIEWIDGASGPGFQVDAGVRIHGGSSRNPASTLKHSLRLSFDDAYGPSDLDFPLFAGSPVDQFDKLVLRGPYTDSWTPRTTDPEYHPSNAQYFRDQWMRDTQRAMGHLSANGRYVQVYLNGFYWGLYNVTEQTDAQFAAEHLGGADEEYDVIKDSEALDGNRQAWDAMMAIANAPAGLAGAAEYQAIQQYLDPVNLADYMLLHIFSGGLDWPDHNWVALRRKAPGEKFHFLVWDQDIGLDDPSASTNHAQVDAPDSPARLYNRLLANPDFRRLLGDRVQKHFFADGELTVAAAQQRYLALAAQIDSAVIAESARWGDVRENETLTTFTRNDWLAERDHVVNELIPQRYDLALSQLQASGLFPTIVAPTYTPHGGKIVAGAIVGVTAPAGTIYYTDDGSDPQLPDGSLNPNAHILGMQTTTLVGPGAAARVLVPTTQNGGDTLGQTWTGAAANEPFADSAWIAATTAVGFPPAGGTEVADFSDLAAAAASGWTEHRAVDATLQTDYGFSTSANAGGTIGEAGGKLPSRTSSVSYYADTSVGPFSQSDSLTASGKFTVTNVDAGYDGGFEIGFFDSSVTEGSPSFIGLRMLENTATTLRWRARAVINGQVVEAAPLAGLTIGTDYTFTITYTYTGGNGHLDVQLIQQSDSVSIGASTVDFGAVGAPAALDAFGLLTLDLGVDAPQSVAAFIDDLTYTSGRGLPIASDIESAMRDVNASALLRTTFSLAAIPNWDALRLRVQYDDAFVAYLNGVEVARSGNAPAAPVWDSSAMSARPDAQVLEFEEFDLSAHLPQLRLGTNVLAIQGLNVSADDADFLLLPELVGIDNLGSSVVLDSTTTLKARTRVGETWSALSEATFVVEPPLRVTEIMYHPGNRTAAEIAAGFLNDDDFEFLEIQNTGIETADLTGVEIAGGVNFSFTGSAVTSLAPGQYVLVVANMAAFAFRYNTAGLHIAGAYTGQLNNSGEELQLLNSLQLPIQTFTYDDIWYPSTDGPGSSLVIIDPHAAVNTWNDAASWRASRVVGGSPGALDPVATVAARHVFYNNSKFDGNSAGANAADDAAIATDKTALLSGAGSFANYTSFNRGLNGIIIDLAGLVGLPTPQDFVFRVGNDDSPAAWAIAPAPLAIAVRPGAGVGGSSRVTIVWADGAIQKQWLQVTVNQSLGLAQPDVFYFGNAVGETGGDAASARVNSTDELAVRNNPRTFLNPATISSPHDFNRDGFVNATDQILSRSNSTTLATALKLINVPGGVQAALASAASVSFAESGPIADNSIATGLAAPASRGARLPAPPLSEATPQRISAALASLEAEQDRQLVLPYELAASHITAARRQRNLDEGLFDRIASDLIASRR